MASSPMSIVNIFKKGDATKSIKVHITDSDIEIDVFVNLNYGVKIPQVSENVQKSVKEAVQNMVGRVVTKVNVNVMDIQLPSGGNGDK